jgi:hypothetical protein
MTLPPTYYFTFIYIWAFPVMVPIFALCFGIFNIRKIWKLERLFYKMNSNDLFLFSHFDRIKLSGLISTMYRCHPFFAGLSLLLSYKGIYDRMMNKNYVENNIMTITYIISSSIMAWCGGQLVPTMYGNSTAKFWTLLQSRIIYIYNILTVISIACNISMLRQNIDILNCTLLFCTGVLERAYVLFVLPLFGFSDESLYRWYYSLQFPTATIGSWIIGIAIILSAKFKHNI